MHRTDKDHVKRLIWGDFSPHGNVAGISEMMNVADSLGVQFTFFLDIAEVDCHGRDIIDAGHAIKARGHDLQLHIHPENLRQETWRELDIARPSVKPAFYPDDVSCEVVMLLVERFRSYFGTTPIAYRGGAFNLNNGALTALARAGVPISSNHSYASYVNRGLSPLAAQGDKLFRWENGVVELGVTDIPLPDDPRGQAFLAFPMTLPKGMNFRKLFASLPRHEADGAPVMMVLHSWSLLSYVGAKEFGDAAPYKVPKLAKIVEAFKEYFDLMSVSPMVAGAGRQDRRVV